MRPGVITHGTLYELEEIRGDLAILHQKEYPHTVLWLRLENREALRAYLEGDDEKA